MQLIASLLIFAGILLLASTNLQSATSYQQSQATFKAESELVVLHVSVRDRGGRYITGLDRDAFTVIDDGKPQTLEMFSADEVPASIGFLIDNSNSMHPNRDRVIAAAVEFARRSHPRDELFVMTFNEQVRHAFGPAVAGEINPAVFHAAMARAIGARGMTAIYDGILSGLKRVGAGMHTRQVLIVVSDGDDNASTATRQEVIRQVRESDATIYTIALIDPLTREGNPGLLRELAQQTGGESYRPRHVEAVGEAFERIAKDIRSAYTLAYAPTTKTARHTVRVYVRPKDGRSVRVRTRDGYFEKTRGGTP
ncbi:MAG TPA: VWA domain-containing protein [Vicinamibacterales bacterium]|nr:VWA domain-containing protein [Vicinamibacterales bacterium]